MSSYYIKVKSCEAAPNAEPEYWSQQTVSATQKNVFYNLGNVGVGVPNPLGKLQVDGSVGIGTAYATTAPPVDGCIISGNVGVGIATPAHKLHVVGNTRIEGDLIVNGTQTVVNTVAGTTERIEVTNDGTGPALRVTQTGAQPIADFCDDQATNVVVRIADGGNVGIGTVNPLAKLHVNGDTLYRGIYANIVRGNGQTLNAGWTSISWETSVFNITNGIIITGGSTNISFNYAGVYMVTLNFRFGAGSDVWTGCSLRSGGGTYGLSHGTGNVVNDPGSISFNFLANITNTSLNYQLDVYRDTPLFVASPAYGFPAFVCTMFRVG